MRRKNAFRFLVLFLLGPASSPAQSPAFTPDDIRLMTGQWKGILTYLDYSTQKPYTMPAAVQITHLPKDKLLVFYHTYPNEPKANNRDTIGLSADGKNLDGATVLSRTVQPGGRVEIVTEKAGVDGNDNKAAHIRHTYTLGRHVFIKRKDVKFDDQPSWINRHTYSYTK